MFKRSAFSRRGFVAGASAAAAACFVPSRLIWGEETPSNKLNIAGVGVGGMGGGNVKACASENIVALCDVDQAYSKNIFAAFPKAKIYTDYRVMLDKQKDIDAVIVGTPDHTHAVITLSAMRAGKHVFTQKPLTHSVLEARTLTEAAGKYPVQTQMGNQGHSAESIRALREWVQAGALGEVREIHAWTDRPCGGPWWTNFVIRELPSGTPAVPGTLDWDLWLGPAAMRPYQPAYCPFKWRGWLDFGTGALGDMGCHILDPSFWALDLGYPSSVQAEVEYVNPEFASQTFPLSSKVTFEFPARGAMPPVKLVWFDGKFRVPRPPMLEEGKGLFDSGAVIYGSKETVIHDSHGAAGLRVIPETRRAAFTAPPKTLPRVTTSHEQDWVRACKDGKPASSPFSYGGPLTELLLVGVIAMRLPGEKLEWNGREMKFTNNDKANALLHPKYREGWTL